MWLPGHCKLSAAHCLRSRSAISISFSEVPHHFLPFSQTGVSVLASHVYDALLEVQTRCRATIQSPHCVLCGKTKFVPKVLGPFLQTSPERSVQNLIRCRWMLHASRLDANMTCRLARSSRRAKSDMDRHGRGQNMFKLRIWRRSTIWTPSHIARTIDVLYWTK